MQKLLKSEANHNFNKTDCGDFHYTVTIHSVAVVAFLVAVYTLSSVLVYSKLSVDIKVER